MELFVFSPRTRLYLDGGRLDLGIVADSTLNATNDRELVRWGPRSIGHDGAMPENLKLPGEYSKAIEAVLGQLVFRFRIRVSAHADAVEAELALA